MDKGKPQSECISNPRYVTLKLIRKRSEHNESLVSDLEEVALHQEELEVIGPILGRTCGKTLKILLLQNNVIGRMHPMEMKLFKSLEYLNLALNNIHVVEGIQHLEFLNKLDLTLNFIDYERLKESVECMSCLRSLRELFMLGNPCAYNESTDDQNIDDIEQNQKINGWKGFRQYVVAKLPQLETLDGKMILRSERIRALQRLNTLEMELSELSTESCREKELRAPAIGSAHLSDDIGDEQHTTHCPEDRARLSQEMARQKSDKEKIERANQPKVRGEKEFQEEQDYAIEKAREREEQGNIRQRNGKCPIRSF
jgi:protein TilB